VYCRACKARLSTSVWRAAFLHVADIWDAKPQDGNPNTALKPIEKLLFDGQSITVQVIKDPIGTKGARLSTQISIAGRMLVFLPQDMSAFRRKLKMKPVAKPCASA
jgi:Rne/Rng family ribonuclease